MSAWERKEAYRRHKLDTATVDHDRTVLHGYSFCRPYLSEFGGNEGTHEWVVRLEGHSLVVIGVAEADCERENDIHQQEKVWCLAAYWGDKVHNGQSTQGFAPSIQVNELPLELTVRVDCTAGKLSVLRRGKLLGGPTVFGGLRGKTLHLAVASGDFRSKITLVKYISSALPTAKRKAGGGGGGAKAAICRTKKQKQHGAAGATTICWRSRRTASLDAPPH